MWFKINIDFTSIHHENIKEAKERLDKFADIVVEWVKWRTPEDTKTLLKAIWKTDQTQVLNRITQKVLDQKKLEYTPYVEYWVLWRSYRYNKPKGTIFLVWVWAWMFRKTYFDLKDKFNEYV